MFIVTNREVRDGKGGPGKLGSKLNPLGPNELRVVEAKKVRGKWDLQVLPDELDNKRKREIKLPVNETAYASQYVAKKLLNNIQRKKRNLLFFVHGFNNDISAVLERADQFTKKYKVEVVAFSWPANGGGVRGAASYKSDKRDAKASIGALDRCFPSSTNT